MKLKKLMFLVLCVIGIVLPVQVSAYPVADYFDYPIGGYNPNDTCLSWGGYNSAFEGTNHVADDYCIAAGTQVKAIGKGKVKYVNNSHDTWYAVMVLEHTLFDGSKICSVYGHVKATQVSVGDEITYTGQPIGEVVQYPPSSNHIHFGVYNGAFNATEGTYPSWLVGYLASGSWPGNYLDPVTFVEFHQNNNPSYFPYLEYSVIKFSDSPDVYYYSGGWLWLISNETSYALLGYNNGNCYNADFGYLINLSSSQRALYTHLIRGEVVPVQGMVARIVDGVGPNTCSALDSWRNPNSIYLFDGSVFRPILSESVYLALGYRNNWTDVVDITQDLFDQYGEGYIIDSPDDAWWIQGGGGGYESVTPAPYNLTGQVLSSSELVLDYNVSWVYTDFEIYLYQDGVRVPQTFYPSSIYISGIPPNTTHCFEVSTLIISTGEESTKSNTVCLTTSPPESNYTFVDSYICDSWQHGIGDEYWNLQPINIHSDFTSGETAQFLVKLENVYVDHRYKMELYRNGSFFREQTTTWNDLDPSQGWDYSSFAPYQQDLMPGNYVVMFYLDTGGGFSVLDSNSFTVTGPNYEYAGSWTCDGWVYGSTDTNSSVYWDWQPVNPHTSFFVGDTVYLLAQLNDVFVDHEWKMEVWKDGSFEWDWVSGWLDVDNVNGWGYSNFAPYIQNASAGNYELKLYLDDGNGFFLIDAKLFTVSAYTENIPYFEDFSTDNHKFTLEDHLSTASLSISETGGVSGGRCLLLANTQSVQSYQVQAKKVGFNLLDSSSYSGSIKIRGAGTGTVYILFERAVSPWDNLGLWRAVNVSDTWQTINLDFTATGNPELDAENVRFTIQAGTFVGDLYIDDIGLN